MKVKKDFGKERKVIKKVTYYIVKLVKIARSAKLIKIILYYIRKLVYILRLFEQGK